MLPLCNFYFHDNFLHFFSLFQVPTSATFYFELKMPSELNYSKYPPQLNSTPIPFSQESNCMKLKIIGIIFPQIFLSFWGALNVVWCCVIIFLSSHILRFSASYPQGADCLASLSIVSSIQFGLWEPARRRGHSWCSQSFLSRSLIRYGMRKYCNVLSWEFSAQP